MFIRQTTRAPWGDITRVARLLGRARGNDSRINAHKTKANATRECKHEGLRRRQHRCEGVYTTNFPAVLAITSSNVTSGANSTK